MQRKYMRYGFIVTLLVFLLPGTSALGCGITGTSYYVSTSGNDANPGTQALPFRTINKASTVVQPGQNVIVLPGTYTQSVVTSKSGTASAPIRYISQQKWGAKLQVNSSKIWQNSGDYVTIEGFDISGAASYAILNYASHVRLLNNHVHHLGNSACTIDVVAGLDHAGKTNPDGGTRIASDNNTVGNVIHDIAYDCALKTGIPGAHGIYHAYGSGLIANNIVYRAQSYGIHLWHKPYNVKVLNNTAHGNRHGMVVGGDPNRSEIADHIYVANNIFSGNAVYGIREMGLRGSDIKFVNNIVANNNSGIDARGGSYTGTIVADPKFVSTAGGDFHLQATSPAIDGGVSAPEVTSDFEGTSRPRNGKWDIGADELGAAASSCSTTEPEPTVNLSASPASITADQSSTLTWSSTGATSCTASGGWTGSKATSGTQSVMPTTTTTYMLSCTGTGGTAQRSATVTVAAPAPTPPTLNLAASPASITSGQSSTLTWSSTNATSCTASGGWTGSKTTSGTQSITPTATATYTLSCTGTGGTVQKSATVTIAAPAPTVNLGVSPASIITGQSSTLTWSSTNATACTASGGWTGAKAAVSGSQSITPSATSTYTLSCTGAGGTTQRSATVTVTAPVQLVKASTLIRHSNNFHTTYPLNNLWDACTNSMADCMTTAKATSFFTEFDFGASYSITQARLFGDANEDWRSKTWTLQYKQTESETWKTAFSNVNALTNSWITQNLSGVQARYVRVTVYGPKAGTQARELQIFGAPDTP